MTLAMPDITEDTDLRIFEDLNLDGVDSCEWMENCPNETAFLVLCSECGSGEAVCAPHTEELKKVMAEMDFVFTFNRTCNHNVSARSCKIIPKA